MLFTSSCNNNSNEGTLFGSQNQMNGQGDQGTLKMNAVHMYCAASKKILRAARAKLQNLGSNLGYPGKSKLHIPSNIQSKHSKVLVPKLHALCVKALPIHPLHVLLLLGLRRVACDVIKCFSSASCAMYGCTKTKFAVMGKLSATAYAQILNGTFNFNAVPQRQLRKTSWRNATVLQEQEMVGWGRR